MLCFTLWNAVVRHLGMVRASNYINFNAVATFVAAFLILGEHVSAVALVGSAAVISESGLRRENSGLKFR